MGKFLGSGRNKEVGKMNIELMLKQLEAIRSACRDIRQNAEEAKEILKGVEK